MSNYNHLLEHDKSIMCMIGAVDVRCVEDMTHMGGVEGMTGASPVTTILFPTAWLAPAMKLAVLDVIGNAHL